MSSLDFNPIGEAVATVDSYGTYLISDVNTDNYLFHMSMESEGGEQNFAHEQTYMLLLY